MRPALIILLATTLLASTLLATGGPAPSQPLTLRQFEQSARAELNGNILAWWLAHSIDTQNGGFLGRITNDNTPIPDAPKGLVLNARILWTFSAAFRGEHNPAYLRMADRAYDYLAARFLDPRHGGAYWMLDCKGNPTDESKELYGQAFVIYALAEYHLASQRPEPLAQALDLFRLIDAKCHDNDHGGYFETFSRDWTAAPNARLAYGVDSAAKTMNTHLHVLEAWTNLYRATKDELLARRLREMINLLTAKIINPHTYHFELFFDAQWNSQKPVVSFGHDIEGSWLLTEAAEVLGDGRLFEHVKAISIQMADACLTEALDKDGGLFYEAEHGKITIGDKHWWAQAETAVGFLNAWELRPEKRFLRAAKANWQFILTHQVDREHGEWFSVAPLDKAPDPKAHKASEWKAPYHNGRACMELSRRLHHLQQLE